MCWERWKVSATRILESVCVRKVSVDHDAIKYAILYFHKKYLNLNELIIVEYLQCIPGYYNYPDCVPCNCSILGSISTTCDVTGKCPCLNGFAGKQCTLCGAGYYKYPECLRKYPENCEKIDCIEHIKRCSLFPFSLQLRISRIERNIL